MRECGRDSDDRRTQEMTSRDAANDGRIDAGEKVFDERRYGHQESTVASGSFEWTMTLRSLLSRSEIAGVV